MFVSPPGGQSAHINDVHSSLEQTMRVAPLNDGYHLVRDGVIYSDAIPRVMLSKDIFSVTPEGVIRNPDGVVINDNPEAMAECLRQWIKIQCGIDVK